MVRKVMDQGGGKQQKLTNAPFYFLCGGGRVVVNSQYVCGLGGEDKFG